MVLKCIVVFTGVAAFYVSGSWFQWAFARHPQMWPFSSRLLNDAFLILKTVGGGKEEVFVLKKAVLTLESVDKILKWDVSNESQWEVLSCGTVILFKWFSSFKFWVFLGETLKCDHSPKQNFWVLFDTCYAEDIYYF